MAGFTITIAGDSALNLEFAHAISAETSAKIRMAADNLTADPIRGITELLPTLRMDTVDSRPSSVVPTGMAKMFPANPVMAWTVYAKKNAARKSAFSIYATILIYVTSLQV